MQADRRESVLRKETDFRHAPTERHVPDSRHIPDDRHVPGGRHVPDDRHVPVGRIAVLFQHNLRLLLADPAPIVVTTLMPLVLMAFLQGMGKAVLENEGYREVSGAEHVVPGMAVLFSLFGVTYLGVAFFQEHGWGTWQRLRAGPAGALEIMIGKLLPSALVIMLQLVVLFAAGFLLFGLRLTGSPIGLLIMIIAATVFLIALSMLCVAVFRTINQLATMVNVGAMVLGGLGGRWHLRR